MNIQAGDSTCQIHNAQEGGGSSTANPSATATGGGGGKGKPLASGAIAGIAVGAVVILGLLALVVFLLFRRRKRDRSLRAYNEKPVDLIGPDTSEDMVPVEAIPHPFYDSRAGPSSHHHSNPSQSSSNNAPNRKGYTSPQSPGFIQHSDIADTTPQAPVELPPQYSDSRQPLQALDVASSTASTGGPSGRINSMRKGHR